MTRGEAFWAEALASARQVLGVTWDDEDLDATIRGHLAQGVHFLEGLVFGKPLSFGVETLERFLLMEFVLFAHNGRADEFFTAHERTLNSLQLAEG